jgi:hypothetical protein
MISEARRNSPMSCFKEVLKIGCQSIWNHHNRIVFDGQQLRTALSL